MTFNYHTHTWRCRHAYGSERQYVEAAIRGGFRTLGFSDHSPYLFPGGYCSIFRMNVWQAPEYFRTVRELRDEYADRIEIHAGVEIEYYPAYFSETRDFLASLGCEYLILGQHHCCNEIDPPAFYSGWKTDDPQRLETYVTQLEEAMEKYRFLCIAHPDLLRFTGDPDVYYNWNSRLCRAARDAGVPLEINMLGLDLNRAYPCDAFWPIAFESGCRVVLGVDAHRPGALCDAGLHSKAEAYARSFGITPETSLPFPEGGIL